MGGEESPGTDGAKEATVAEEAVLKFKLAGHPTETTDRAWCPKGDARKVLFRDIKKKMFQEEITSGYKINLFFSGRKVLEDKNMEDNKIPDGGFLHAWFYKPGEGQTTVAAVNPRVSTKNRNGDAATSGEATVATRENQEERPTGIRRVFQCCCIT